MSGAELLNRLIAGRDGNCSYSTELSIENAEPVSTSASQPRTPSITVSVNSSGAPVPADATALVDFAFDSAGCDDCCRARVKQNFMKWPIPPQEQLRGGGFLKYEQVDEMWPN